MVSIVESQPVRSSTRSGEYGHTYYTSEVFILPDGTMSLMYSGTVTGEWVACPNWRLMHRVNDDHWICRHGIVRKKPSEKPELLPFTYSPMMSGTPDLRTKEDIAGQLLLAERLALHIHRECFVTDPGTSGVQDDIGAAVRLAVGLYTDACVRAAALRGNPPPPLIPSSTAFPVVAGLAAMHAGAQRTPFR